jgi:hypothetical protein
MTYIPENQKKEIGEMLKPGDAVCTIDHVPLKDIFKFNLGFTGFFTNLFEKVALSAVLQGIQEVQKLEHRQNYNHGPKKDEIGWKFTHVRLVLPDGQILSVTHPKAKFENWDEISWEDLFFYRPTFEITSADANNMLEFAETLKGIEYDVGQLIDIGIANLLGYEKIHVNILGNQKVKESMVCSVGYTACVKYAQKKRRGQLLAPGKQNPDYNGNKNDNWPNLFEGKHVENIMPWDFWRFAERDNGQFEVFWLE